MAHPQQKCFMEVVSKHLAPERYTGRRILEIGSYDVNGSIRSLFLDGDYTGVDLIPGPGVDLVAEGDKISFAEESFDITVSCECFEHNPKWLETFKNMYRMTKSGGVVIFTCATTGRLEHGTSRTNPLHSPGTYGVGWDYYRNVKESDFRKHLAFDSLFGNYLFLENRRSKDLYFVGQKSGGKIFELNTRDIANQYALASRKLEISISKNHPYPKYIRLLAFISLLPVNVASVLLPEKYFQNFSVKYCRMDSAIKAWVLRAFSKHIHRNEIK